MKELETCDFERLQSLCKEKGFFVYKTKESPICTEECKKIWKKGKSILIYSEYSLSLVNDFKHRHLKILP